MEGREGFRSPKRFFFWTSENFWKKKFKKKKFFFQSLLPSKVFSVSLVCECVFVFLCATVRNSASGARICLGALKNKKICLGALNFIFFYTLWRTRHTWALKKLFFGGSKIFEKKIGGSKIFEKKISKKKIFFRHVNFFFSFLYPRTSWTFSSTECVFCVFVRHFRELRIWRTSLLRRPGICISYTLWRTSFLSLGV